jgi:hypothetical protein
MGQRSVGANPSLADSYQEVVLIDPVTGAHRSPLSTYSAEGVSYTAYATPTDLFGIRGSATKIIRVLNMRLQVHSTSAAGYQAFFVKRSTANTGGTLTNPTAVKYDSADAAATAVIDLYTAAPTTGDSAGTLRAAESVSAVATVAPAITSLYGITAALVATPNTISFVKPVTLRGVNEALYLNWGGAAIPAGFSAAWAVEWTESAV